MLQGKRLKLRALEPEDLDYLVKWENDTSLWHVCRATEPYSRYIIREYISQCDKTIYEKKQLRLMITTIEDNETVGMIDLTDFDPFHSHAGVGIIIDYKYQHKGYASEALQLLIDYSFNFLNIHQLYAEVPANNTASKSLFIKNDFLLTGSLKEWIRMGNTYVDVDIYQLINNNK